MDDDGRSGSSLVDSTRLDFLTTHASGIAACVERHITSVSKFSRPAIRKRGKKKEKEVTCISSDESNEPSKVGYRPYGKRFSTLEKFHLSREGEDEDEDEDEDEKEEEEKGEKQKKQKKKKKRGR
ncbi:hypothetical protein V1477_021293 [Vespula maculifrons]|uniref:Uncharacterized protein n=1 Tax=Vespula maculifrons TaxID=7453 RepID=A0ABD2AGQ1_VESMC